MSEALKGRHQVVHKPGLVDVGAQQFGDLVQHDDHTDAGLEPHQHRFGNEVGDKAQPQYPCHNQDCPHHQRQRGGRREQRRCIAVGADLAECRAGQDGQRRGGADAEWARTAEQRINHHRHQRGVQADLHRKAGDGGVRQCLGNHHRRGGEPGDDVTPEPVGPIVAEPLGNQQVAHGTPALNRRNSFVRMAALLIHE
ncbi:hypothetical protein D3C81_1295810 [compost metagenome]